jgi:hypothetical protein
MAPGVWLIVNAKNGISSYELGRSIGVTQKTAWFMGHRIRAALHAGSFAKLTGESRLARRSLKVRHATCTRDSGSVVPTLAVQPAIPQFWGMLVRGGKAITMVVRDRTKKTLQPAVRKCVNSDELQSYGAPNRCARLVKCLTWATAWPLVGWSPSVLALRRRPVCTSR